MPLGARSAGNKIDLYYLDTYGQQHLISSARDSMPAVDLSSYNAKKLDLKVVATDALGRTAFESLAAYVETSPYLTNTFLNDENLRASGKVTNIAPGLPGYKWYPATDGKNIIYSTSFFGDTEAYLYFYNGQAQINVKLGDSPVNGPSRGLVYQMNRRYLAFLRRKQLVLRDSLGGMREMTSFADCPACPETMIALNEQGDAIVSRTDSGMFLVRNNGQIKHITSTPLLSAFNGTGWAGASYDGSDFYLSIGNRLFKLNLDSVPPVDVSDFETHIKPDSTLHLARLILPVTFQDHQR